MSLWKYIKKEKLPLPDGHSCPTLSSKELRLANEQVKDRLAGDTNKARKQATRGKYNEYTPEERAQIGKYAAENGPTRAARYSSELMNRKVPETTARRLKAEYLHKVRELRSTVCDENTPASSCKEFGHPKSGKTTATWPCTGQSCTRLHFFDENRRRGSEHLYCYGCC